MKKIFFILLMITTSIFSQKQVNKYKYVIVPNKFDFVKEKDKYQTSSLTKFLFNKYGFVVFLADENLPEDLVNNKCLALFGTVKNNSSLFTTKTIVELRDCSGKIIYSSKEGISKEKDYKKAYHEAIRNSFESIKKIKYKYEPVASISIQKEVKKINKPSKLKVISDRKRTTKNIKYANVISLYAQPTVNGFQLINTKPEVVYQILKTSVEDVFILKNKKGILYKDNNIWVVEFYSKGLKFIENYQIKF
ncbi:hypothetical protein CXF68_19685 [Tenacibaculum sp. Bg11-29]|uniref:hypothetical protein n=1 Tax=Tenacibaculum sp. Bg11-29 TaxID=2058306 RepID=UPI000C349366|nr:hypothetical protein [Tenacibaculum sp. Bg11-29]PKH52780.1 hypothetical protein CXF68_19685 [Tenacibaculum sp. Bg11-29]